MSITGRRNRYAGDRHRGPEPLSLRSAIIGPLMERLTAMKRCEIGTLGDYSNRDPLDGTEGLRDHRPVTRLARSTAERASHSPCALLDPSLTMITPAAALPQGEATRLTRDGQLVLALIAAEVVLLDLLCVVLLSGRHFP